MIDKEQTAELCKRPRMRLAEERARMLIDAAAAEFLSRGYRRGSVENIARTTGIGKATIYRHFSDKDGLFQAAVSHVVELLKQPSFDFSARTDAPDTVLADFALRSLDLFLRDRNLALHRIVIEAGHIFPQLARMVHQHNTHWSLDTLRPYLDHLAQKGVITVEDTGWAAHQFLSLATHGILYLMTPAPTDEAERRALASETVQLFLGGAPAMRAL